MKNITSDCLLKTKETILTNVPKVHLWERVSLLNVLIGAYLRCHLQEASNVITEKHSDDS